MHDRRIRRFVLLIPLALVLASCGEDGFASVRDSGGDARSQSAATTARTTTATTTIAQTTKHARTGTKIVLRRSEFGKMLFNGKRQAIYIFQNDRPDKSVCYGACARAWPPVYTKGAPRAFKGARATLLGTIRRRNGRRQVTYAGKPLYYYAHEDRGEVLCHDVYLNGGLWWAVGRSGTRRP